MQNLGKKMGVVIAGLSLWMSLSSVALAGGMDSAPSTIYVTGEGKAQAQADNAIINVSIDNTEKTGREARMKNNSVLKDLKAALVSLGLPENSASISYSSGYPNFEFGENNSRKLTSYSASMSVSIMVKDISKIDSIIDKISDFDSLTVQTTNYMLSDTEKVTDQAREKAVADAAKKAQKLAKLYNVTLGPVYSISESAYIGTPYAGSGMMPSPYGNSGLEMTDSLSVGYQIIK